MAWWVLRGISWFGVFHSLAVLPRLGRITLLAFVQETVSWGKEGARMAWALKLPLADEVIESGLVQDFDASLSGIGQELGAGAYSMR